EMMADTVTQTEAVRQEATRLLGVVGEFDLEAALVEAALNTQIDALKTLHQGTVDSLRHAGKAAQAELEDYCAEHKAELLPEGLKHVPLLYGRIGWRTPPPSVKTQRGTRWEEAARRLRRLGHPNLVREQISVHKPALQESVIAGAITSVDLKAAGLRIVQGRDRFEIKLDHDQIRKLMRG
ncbi:unnamed protein product, partial [marine sediment metagenome]